MKKILIFVVSLFIAQFSNANGVCWCGFEVLSQNKQFKAVISPVADSVDKPDWKTDWKIEVYKLGSGIKALIWESDYDYSGKPTGQLSDDGQYFTYVENWYYKELPLLTIYKAGRKIATDLDGNSFSIAKRKLKKTSLHYLWLAQSNVPYEYKTSEDGITILMLRTVDKRELKVNLDYGILITSISSQITHEHVSRLEMQG
ncbi:hypothetical protein SAMN04489724_4774 [Algoriphagus locisalis]|uniref:Uncharacterized protein n=1 Tax=Algoriphagus locisalis TaxID=305507 RepID=A0A1I7E2L9_9BACT|nr:hypothetical protein [Algoriphagus locisalis]SFU18146.1 hypothetical protein SAMN04489724_4774 [Algoriphagus locisalis]